MTKRKGRDFVKRPGSMLKLEDNSALFDLLLPVRLTTQ